MKVFIILILSLFNLGCNSQKLETPKQRFNIFIHAIESNQVNIVEQSLKSGSYEYLKADAGVIDPANNFINRLIKDTKASKPKYMKTDWVLRNKIARVYYTYNNNQKDFLILEKLNNQWYINLFQKEKFKSSNITKFVAKTK